MSTSPTDPPQIFDYASNSSRGLRKRRLISLAICFLILAGPVYFGWKYGLPALRRYLALRELSAQLNFLEADLAKFSNQPTTINAASLAKISQILQPLQWEAQRLLGENALFAAGGRTIQAGQLTDPDGTRWNVIVCGGEEQISTVAWKVGSSNLSSVVSWFTFSIGHAIQPPSRIRFPASQPSSDQKSFPIDFLIDGVTQRAVLTIDALGHSHGRVDGWQDIEGPPGSMVWGEVGRYGYHNVDLNPRPFKTISHPSPIAIMRFMSDGRLTVGTQGRLEVVDLKNETTQTIDRPQDKDRWFYKYRMSRDGRFFLVPPNLDLEPILVDLFTREERKLPSIPKQLQLPDDFGFDPDNNLFFIDANYLTRLDFINNKVDFYHLAGRENGPVQITPVREVHETEDGSHFTMLSAARGKLVVRHPEAETYIFSQTQAGWDNGKHIDVREGTRSCLSPDGRWLASYNGNGVIVYDSRNDKVVFEAAETGQGHDDDNEQVSWSDDATLVALAPRGRMVLCLLGEEKLAIRLPFPTVKIAGPPMHAVFCLSPDGSLLAVMDNSSGELALWRTVDLVTEARKITFARS